MKINASSICRASRFVSLVFVVGVLSSPWLKADPSADGADVFKSNCAACHQPDGSGLTGMYPALKGSARVSGDADTLVKILLVGPANVLPADRPHYSGSMPPFSGLTDDQIAALLTYVRAQFGNNASAIQATQVAAVRASTSK